MPQLYSSVAGNIFGMKALKNLRLEDIDFSEKYVKSFKGPQFGIAGVRKFMNIYNRPLTATVPKPKLGMTTEEYCKTAKDIWSGGLDIVKTDENMTSQKFVKKCGGEFIMIDIVTAGWAGSQTIRNEAEDLKLAIHAHRAMHAAFTRNPKHGISMLTLAKCARLVGVDNIHIGTAVGKLVSPIKEVLGIEREITGEEIEETLINENGHILQQEWYNIKPVFPVSSGGLHPGLIPYIMRMLGKHIILQCGGGVTGNPLGTKAGAVGMRQAIEATLNNRPLKEYAKNHKELKAALDKWGYKKPI